ncbi:MAG: helix-turn-helix domain-containing protein [Planctomycetota bacterium]|jgi:predicted transcriptional regulator
MPKVKRTRFKEPFKDEVPPNTKEREAELIRSMEQEGQRELVEVDEEDNILSGHLRHKVFGDDIKFKRLTHFKSEAHKRAYVHLRGRDGKELDAAGRRKRRANEKKCALDLRAEGWTQAQIAQAMCVSQPAVSQWLGKNISTNNNAVVTQGTDDALRDKVVELLKAGKSLRAIARELHIGERRIADIRDAASLPVRSDAIPESTVEAVAAGVRAGKSDTAIAAELGISATTVRKYIRQAGLERPKKAVGPVPKSTTDRAIYCEALMADGDTSAVARGKCGFANPTQMRRALAVAHGASVPLKDALNEEVLTLNKAAALVGQTDSFIQGVIDEAKAKQAAKQQEAVSPRGNKKRLETITIALNAIWHDWTGYQGKQLKTTTWIPRTGKKADELRTQLDAAERAFNRGINTIRNAMGDA